MTASAPWSVKGIDAKAREVAKDLARRSGMTLGEWLNQMILEGEDVGALISREKARAEKPVAARAQRPGARPARRIPEAEYSEDYEEEDDYAEPEYAPRVRRAPAYREVYNELADTGGRMARNDPPARRPAAPYSSGSQTLSSRDLRRKSIFEDRPREGRQSLDDGYTAEEARYEAASSDLSRVARALETLGARMESSESRSATAVRGVSHAVESVLSRLERSEAAHAETRDELQGRINEQSQEVLSSFERLARAEEDQSLFADRLGQAERLIDAQAERLEGLSGHVREERERLAKFEERLNSNAVQDTVRAVEGALGKLANQLYEGETRTRDTLKDVREDMVSLSHRIAQAELRDPDRAAQALIDKVVAQMAHRLEAAEAQTSGAIKTLEQAFQALEGRLNRVEEGGDVTDPEAMRSLTGLAADLSRRVEESRQDLLGALKTGKQETIELAVKVVGERIDQSEKRSAGAIERMGQDVMRIADNLNRRMSGVETASHDGISRVSRDVQRIADTVEGRLGRTENAHAQALERLGGEIARISERLAGKLAESERRTTQVLGAVGEQFEAQRGDLAERIRKSEERTAKLLEDTRARIDSRLAQVQTQSLLAETVARPAAPREDDTGLPNPFGNASVASAAKAPAEKAPEPVRPFEAPRAEAQPADEEQIDLTGQLLGKLNGFGQSDFKPEFDPFEEEDLEADLVMNAPLSAPAPARAAAPAPVIQEEDDDDSDPFADIEVSRKTAPRTAGSAGAAAAFAERAPAPAVRATFDEAPEYAPARPAASPFDDDEEAPVSTSTRDALAAARAAVRASIEGEDRGLGGLKSGPSRTRGVKAETPAKAKGGSTFLNAIKASGVAVAVVAVGTGSLLTYNKLKSDKDDKATPIAATALSVKEPSGDTQQTLRTRYDLAVQALEARDPKAIDLMKVVANQGYAPAQYRLGSVYKNGYAGVSANKGEARVWIKRAAEGGVPEAMNEYGYMTFNGEGGGQDRSTAALWFRKAAERGVVDAQFNLAQLYKTGDGVPVNPSEAYKWMQIAANNGAKDAEREAAALAAQLTEAQRARAQDAIARFTPISDGAPIAPAGSEG